MIAAFDVHYEGDERATAAALLFVNYADPQPALERRLVIEGVLPYISGQFYRRELPCILALIDELHETPDEIIIDGYVSLRDGPGLGLYVFDALSRRVPVIGVAKSPHRDAPAVEVRRGTSRRPLYVAAAGMDVREAAERIRSMHGPHRIPTLLKRVDMVARGRRL